MTRIANLFVTAGFAVAVIAPGALIAKSNKHPRPLAAHIAHLPQVRQPHVACTVLGCQIVPAACYPKEEHTSSGIPTGFDQIICPPGVWPF
jgi:hypothetical protein